jgi:broad specificity phosphatase PhoE
MALALVMVGLPARGKTYTARKVARYLSWRGVKTKVFNVGNYRRARSGAQVPHSFFDPANPEGFGARREAAEAAMSDMIGWFSGGGEVGIYDATNSTRERRAWVMAELGKVGASLAFIESICEDPALVEANIRETKLGSPDYVGIEPEDAAKDFSSRIEHYLSVYEPLEEGDLSWIKIVDAGRQVIVNRAEDYLLTKVAAFVMNLHLIPKTLWFSRHGQSEFNIHDRVGGDSGLSPQGQIYAQSLARFFSDKDRPQVWTSTLRRTLETSAPLGGPDRSWKALDEINAGICDGMTYLQIDQEFPGIASARRADKLGYRYPQGESYVDVIERLEPVIFELERSRESTLVIAHQAILRALYAYFTNHPREDVPYLSVPLHTVTQITPKTYGCVEMRFSLPPQVD